MQHEALAPAGAPKPQLWSSIHCRTSTEDSLVMITCFLPVPSGAEGCEQPRVLRKTDLDYPLANAAGRGVRRPRQLLVAPPAPLDPAGRLAGAAQAAARPA